MSRYGTLIAWAKEIGHDNVVSLLNANLKEEKAADKKLTQIAESSVNRQAAGGGHGVLEEDQLRLAVVAAVAREDRCGEAQELAAMITGEAPRAYLCAGRTCAAPVADADALEQLVREFRG